MSDEDYDTTPPSHKVLFGRTNAVHNCKCVEPLKVIYITLKLTPQVVYSFKYQGIQILIVL